MAAAGVGVAVTAAPGHQWGTLAAAVVVRRWAVVAAAIGPSMSRGRAAIVLRWGTARGRTSSRAPTSRRVLAAAVSLPQAAGRTFLARVRDPVAATQSAIDRPCQADRWLEIAPPCVRRETLARRRAHRYRVVEWRVATGPALEISQVALVWESVRISAVAHVLAAAIVHRSAAAIGRGAEIVHQLVAAIDPEAETAPVVAIALAAVLIGLVVEVIDLVAVAIDLAVVGAPEAAATDRLSAAGVIDLVAVGRENNGDLATGRAVPAIVLATGIVRAEATTTSSMAATTSTRSSTGRIGIVRTGTGRTGDGAAAVAGPATGTTTAFDPTTAGTTAAGTVAGEVTGTLRSRGAPWVGGSAR